jgi:alkanesulfonate monooxygenase SsuD/methylene tetrahydromethanopterin reductase-like flavin-dependent oxidoreductase (luciferase family)
VLVSLLSQPSTTFEGTYYRLDDAQNEPKGPQRPHPPICIGGGGEQRTLRTAARFAQHWNFTGGPPEAFAHKREVLHAHCADIGRDPAEITLSSHVPYDAATGPSATADLAAALGEVGLDLAIVYLRPPLDPSVLGPLADALAQLT